MHDGMLRLEEVTWERGLYAGCLYNTVILFARDTQWEEFLQHFYSSLGGTWIATARDHSQEYDTSSSSGCQCYHIDLYDFCLQIINYASNTLWVDFSWFGPEDGTYFLPYNTLGEAVSGASAGDTIVVKHGSSSEILTIQKSVDIEACGTVTVGN